MRITRITRKLVVGFLAISILALLITLTGPWAGARGTEAGAAPRCTRHAAGPGDAARSARPGDVVCFDGDLTRRRLVITKGGTPRQPIVYSGRGDTVNGITVEADNVVVQGFRAVRPRAPGIELTGRRITLRDNTVIRPKGGDGDGIRFFGDDLTIAHNTVRDTDNSGGRHADCMQTFASDTPPSHRVRIEGNRCEQVDNMCLMAEAPNDGEGDGRGASADFVIKDNFCETLRASQALMFENVQNATITGNTFAAPTHHAIGLAVHSTGARVRGNTLHAGIRYEVGIDASSRRGYEGPEPGGEP
ncbi:MULTISPECIES: right-handed parallel beta-helix repeat-containing protein [Streptomyces]|uniref:Right-handed parallel beta-helix repeat-containing protein n=1 Tax=Streptomyces lonegramiae TaxID=3075524 RepID=A0ABU2XLG6_9ACTN|nr:right-handed parallel beta-helix repeat-containing protein [Streptomyces sp. DSM 41529]MDT0546371.1 right-handed parallel beta-helix repeat-containing protein [Streptomyces sp. DSM 41529]